MCPPKCRNVTDTVTAHVDAYRADPRVRPEDRNVTTHVDVYVDVFGRAHSNGNSNLCHLPLQYYFTYNHIK